MRRSRSALTAWPAFADLMTVLAVLGLAIAAGVAVIGGPGEDKDRIPALKAKLEAAQQRNDSLEAELAAARQRNDSLEAELAAARQRIEELEEEVTRGVLGSMPCLGTRPGSPTTPVPLLQIVVDSGYLLTPLWPPEKEVDVADIPQLVEAIAHGPMQEGDLLRYAGDMHAYGNADDNIYGGPCRFWVELRKGETTSQAAFSRAVGLVGDYFLFTNPSEVLRILREAE